eukprot:1674396-Lingulodinium_polyedra.AAC.1
MANSSGLLIGNGSGQHVVCHASMVTYTHQTNHIGGNPFQSRFHTKSGNADCHDLVCDVLM